MKKINFIDLILYEDDNLILINKPPFIASLEDRNSPVNILNLARTYHKEAQICHRLDKETSGIMVCAKNNDTFKHVTQCFEHRKIIKTYHAVVNGIHEFDHVVSESPIHASNKGVVKIDFQQGKQAKSTFTTIEAFHQHTLVSCIPTTGRMHQIRIHLSNLDAPIVNDEKYGGGSVYLSNIKRNFNLKKDTAELPLIKRVALHAYKISFQMPGEKEVYGEAPYPKDFDVLIKQLRKHC